MKIKNIACIATILAASLSGARAATTTLTSWNFDNDPIAYNSTPLPSTGVGSATVLGMGNSYNNTNSLSHPDIVLLTGSNGWRIRGFDPLGANNGGGWSTNAPIGTQGAQFAGSTLGYYKVNFSFDVYATTDAEANLVAQYSTDGGTTWFNAMITSVGTVGTTVIDNSSGSDANSVQAAYVKLASGWNRQITVDLTGISGVANDGNFVVRFVNASTGASCVDTTGAVYNNLSGSWTFDNVAIQGGSIDIVTEWTFESETNDGTIFTNPVPEMGDTNTSHAQSLGFNNNYTYSTSPATTGSTDASDINNSGSAASWSSSGPAGPNAWRVRGKDGTGKAGIGWAVAAPIATQGAEFDVSTFGYSNIVVNFDVYFTSAAEAKLCVLYTTNGTDWPVASKLFYGANPSYIQTNSSSPNTVAGTYFYERAGQNFYNNIIVDFTGVPGVENNPSFAFKVVNAATLGDCVNNGGTAYNNSSGNWRYDNVTVGGTAGTPPPVMALDPNATVDAPFTVTFTDNPAWRGKIANIYVNGQVLTNAAYSLNAGSIVFDPAQSTLLQSSGLVNISILAQGFGTARITQPLAAGVATHLAFTTPAAGPTASGGTLVGNPVLAIADKYQNSTTNPYVNVSVTASTSGAAGWTLGGDTTQTAVNGVMTFSNLTATVNGSTAVSGAVISFAVTGYQPLAVTNSAAFNIREPAHNFTPGNLAVLQADVSTNNTTFSIIEIQPSVLGQTNPVNVVPISATGTNGLRMSSSGSAGKLGLSDDGTLLCFAAFLDDSAATPDETLNLYRAAVGLDYTNKMTIGLRYYSTSYGGSQARSCTTTPQYPGGWIVDDKGGLYEGDGSVVLQDPNLNNYNNVVVKCFGGLPYVETQKAVGHALPVIYHLEIDDNNGGLYDTTKAANGLVTDSTAGDFYMISTNGGTSYDVMYILDQNSNTNGAINKYSLVNGYWSSNGSFTNGTGGDSLLATTNSSGGVYLYFTTAPKGSTNNSVVRVTDSAGWNAPLTIVSSNVIYKASGGAQLKGISFVPQRTAYAAQLIPSPILIAQNGAKVGSTFTVTNTPDDATWRSAITSITVNGTTQPTAAYNTTQAGKITFDTTKSLLLQSAGAKTIVISVAGYSTGSVIQTLTGAPASLITNAGLNGGNMSFAFTNLPGLSFSVLGTNNLLAPKASWPVIGNAVENPAGSGHYQFTDLNASTNGAMFYLLRQP
jgi:hypothetical protein